MGESVLEVGCGRGYLAGLLSNNYRVTASDLMASSNLRSKYPQVQFVEANIQSLPFKKSQFDTVVCTHTLEHVQDIFTALIELRRVTKKRLIIVVPKQRPYRYTFNLHLHFFPYAWSVRSVFGHRPTSKLEDAGGDWFYIENN